MINLKFRYASAKNFLCFGDQGIELFFEDYENIVLINGINHDTGTDIAPASNGAGKSAIQDIISYALYGKTVKRPKKLNHGVVIHALSKKKLEVVVEFDEYRVLRGREPDKLRIWKSKDHLWDETTDITPGGKGEPQALIDKLIGLNHPSFCAACVFDDSNAYAFLEQPEAEDKRKLVENMMGLDTYREYHEIAKEFLKDAKKLVAELIKDYEHLQNDIESHNKRITKMEEQDATWRSTKQREIKELTDKIKLKQNSLETLDSGRELTVYQEAQERLGLIHGTELPENQGKKTRVEETKALIAEKKSAIEEFKTMARSKIQTHNDAINKAQKDLEDSERTIASLQNMEDGKKCRACHGTIHKENYATVIKHEQNIIDNRRSVIEKETALRDEEQKLLDKNLANLKRLTEKNVEADAAIQVANDKIRNLQNEAARLSTINKPVAGAKEQILESEIVELKKQLQTKQDELKGSSPYKELLEAALQEKSESVKECEAKTKELKEAEKEVPYCEYWVEAFSDKGIRKYIIEGIIPSLNRRIAYWMQYLIDSKIEVTFDNEFNETVTRNGSPAVYHAMSNGEKRRINLAVSQSFSHVMMMNSGKCPSLVFLDEITGGGIDRAGVNGIYNMIFELAKERQVFVTTHNQILLDMLQGCKFITLVKQNDVSTLEVG